MKKRLTLFVLFLSMTFSLSAQINDKDSLYEIDHQLTLFKYMIDGQLDSVKQYVAKYDIDLSYYDKKNASDILFVEVALANSYIDIYHYLMEVDNAYKSVYSDLLIAALENDFDTVISLIRGGADVNSTTPSGFTPLMFAVYHHNKEAYVQLVALGAKTENIGGYDLNISDVVVSVMEKDIAKLLIDQGVDINRKLESYNRTLLYIMVENGRKDQARFLLELGVDINDQNNDMGYTPLMIAIVNEDIEMMKLLLEFNPDLNRVNDFGETALTKCLSSSNSIGFISTLFDRIVDINVLDADGRSLLMTAIYYGRTDIARLLIKAGIDINVVDKYGNTALSIANDIDDDEFLQLLQAAGAK